MAGEDEYEKGRCPTCSSERADKKKEHKVSYRSQEYDADSYYMILECRGCGGVYFKVLHTNSEDIDYIPNNDVPGGYEMVYGQTITYWPPSGSRKRPDWLDDLRFEDVVLGRLLDDVYTAMNSDLGVLAAIGMRTTFDRAAERLGINTELPFARKLAELQAQGHIGANEEKILDALVDAGNAAAHRGWRPNPRLLQSMIIILETFLHRAFILPGLGVELKDDVPQRPARNKAKATP